MPKFDKYDIQELKLAHKEALRLFQFISKNKFLKTPTLTFLNKPGNSVKIYDSIIDVVDNKSLLIGYIELLNKIQKQYNQLHDKQAISVKRPKTKATLSARGWHKDHNNYNKAEKWELPPSLRRTPARNVTKTGAKRKRATPIKKYKR